MNKLSKKHFEEILILIQRAKTNTFQSVNRELINLYWNIGEYITHKVNSSEWGEKTVVQLAEFINHHYPDLKGFNRRGLYRMKQFYEAYRDHPNVSALRTQISWTHHRIIMTNCKTIPEKEFYIRLTVQENYSTRELERQVESCIFERSLIADKKLEPIKKRVPQDLSGVFRDQYIFEFLKLPKDFSERDLRKSLLNSLREFILEIGRDFCFIGEEYRLQVGKDDFYIDLLFYHRTLSCLVAFELKIVRFKPEFLGKMDFYLEALDRQIKKSDENPSIGVLLCKSKDDEVVEYALARSASPAVISDYEVKLIPRELLRKKLREFYEIANSCSS